MFIFFFWSIIPPQRNIRVFRSLKKWSKRSYISLHREYMSWLLDTHADFQWVFVLGLGIHSPKLIGGSSELGASPFKLAYNYQPAYLAQSLQSYKQMSICGGFGRVFEAGPVFRSEKSNTHRHLCEFIGLDAEMEIKEHYFEVCDIIDC